MKKRSLSFVIGAALAASVGTVSADTVLTDSEMDAVTAGVGFDTTINVFKDLFINELIQEVKLAVFDVQTTVTGWSAVSEATSDADGPNADAQTFTITQIEQSAINPDSWFKVNSLAKSIALVSN